jgi:hypothetical protein
MYLQSLLVLRALTDRRTGAVIAGARDGWAYVWPRDAGTVALAFAAAGYRPAARRVARFLLRLDLDAAARFYPDGTPVEGRGAQGDARGWVEVAARAAGLPAPARRYAWRGRADYQEKSAGNYLANAIASGASGRELRALLASRLDSAVAWAVQPFPRPSLFPAVRGSLRRLIAARGGRFGTVPSEDWPEENPWTAPTAWTAWAFAALANTHASAVPLPCYLRQRNSGADGDRRAALQLMNDLRRAATPLGLLPERVDAETGAPRSTTPLAWSHAFAILALRELWPG